MNEFDEINSKNESDKIEKLKEYYRSKVNIDKWLTNDIKNTIISFKDRVEYKKNNKYHRMNGAAIDFDDDDKDQYFYKGEKYESKKDWEKKILPEIRKIKLNKIKKA